VVQAASVSASNVAAKRDKAIRRNLLEGRISSEQ